MKAYKGFDKDLKCRGFQYEIGKAYDEDGAKLCDKGFHACEHPLDCFRYYPPADSRYCEVELDDNGERHSDDTKVCGKHIKIGGEIGINGLIHAAFEYTKSHCTNEKMGANQSALTGGNQSALTGGYRSALTGGNQSALTGGNRSALTGGYQSALTGGYRSVVYGGEGAKVRGGLRSVLAIQYWKDFEFQCIKFKEVDGKKIKPDTWYKLDKAGRFIEVKDDECK